MNKWIDENVLENLQMKDEWIWCNIISWEELVMKWDSKYIKYELTTWLKQFEEVEMWSDCMSYDWVLFNTLLADYSDWYPQLPYNVNYIPFDICTLFKIKWIDPDISREDYACIVNRVNKHNALFDAKIIKMCYDKLVK